jgi:hypothetical protein
VSSDFEIKHYYMELRNLIWHEKVRSIQLEGKEIEDKMNEFYIADLMVKVIKKVGNNINNYPSIRSIIDQ